MKFSFDEDTVLYLSALSNTAYGAHSFAAPAEFQKMYYTENVPRSDQCTRHFGQELLSLGALQFAVTTGDECSIGTKRRALKALSVIHGTCAAHMAYHVNKNDIPTNIGLASVAGQTALAALCAWQGFQKEEEKVEEIIKKK